MGNRQGLDGGEAEAENLEVKMMMPKIPVIKKMNPPKPGGKRAPPPPPKK